MANPFETDLHHNPYVLNPFTITEIRPDQWRPNTVQADLEYALQKSRGGRPREVGGVVIDEPIVNHVYKTFQDANLRLDYTLVAHAHHRAPKSAQKDLCDRIDALCPEIGVPARSLALKAELLKNLTLEPTSGTVSPMSLPPRERLMGPRSTEVPLAYLDKEILK